MGDPAPQLARLSAEHKADIRKGIAAALAVSHTELAHVCAHYSRTHNLTYAALQQLMNGTLPDYLTSVPETPPPTPTPAKRLTDEQAATFIDFYQAALMGSSPKSAVKQLFAQYVSEHRVPRQHLDDLVAADRKRHPVEYRAIDALTRDNTPKTKKKSPKPPKPKSDPLRGKPAELSVADYCGRATYCPVCHKDFDADVMPRHGSGLNGCRGAGRFGISLYAIHLDARNASTGIRFGSPTVSGGLPGLGRH